MTRSYVSRCCAVLTVYLLAPCAANAQSAHPNEQGPAFDVASIKTNTSGGPAMRFTFQPGGRMVMVTLAESLSFALGRAVVDATGLTEHYALALEYLPEGNSYPDRQRPDPTTIACRSLPRFKNNWA